jgi:hypothetical protein
MKNHLRLSEKWFNRGLWLIAVFFAYFLIGLGGTIVGDLPKIENKPSINDFVDQKAKSALLDQLKALDKERDVEAEKYEQAKLQQQAASEDYQAAKQAFDVWVTTRNSTKKSDQDPALINRTKKLEDSRNQEREFLSSVESVQKSLLDIDQKKDRVHRELAVLDNAARVEFDSTYKKIELRVFLYRLAFVLPLLLVAVYLFVKHRKQTYWPFVWGFILFSLFAFFVELVPYMPSYGGYVRYTVGVLMTFVVGKYSIAALQKYIQQQKELEKQPDVQRKNEIEYDLALIRINKGICPSCERPIVKEQENFCQHCGIGIFENCNPCGTRKIAFSKFCFHCGKKSERP